MKQVKFFLLLGVLAFLAASCAKDEECPPPSTENTERVKAMLGSFGSGDIPGFLNGCAADCVFDITGNQILNPGKVYEGHAGFMSFLGDLSVKGQPTAINATDFYESGDVVTVQGNLSFKDLSNNQTCTVQFIQLWKFEGDKMVFFKEDHDHRICQ